MCVCVCVCVCVCDFILYKSSIPHMDIVVIYLQYILPLTADKVEG